MRASAAMWVLALAACAPGPSASPRLHPAILSLNPCTDAMLVEVATPGQIVALSAYSRDPAQSSMDVGVARRFPATRGTVEEVAMLRPDLVVTGSFTPPAERAAMARLGVRLEEFGSPRSVGESEAQVTRLAALAGHPALGASLNARIDAALHAASPPGPARPSVLIWEAGGMVAGPDTLIAALARAAGFADFAAARGLSQAQMLPLERVLADPPTVVLTMGDASQGDRMLAHPALAALAHARRYPVDPALAYCGGPTIIRAVTRLAAIRRAVQ